MGVSITSLFLSKVSSFSLTLVLPEDPVPGLAVPLEPSVIQRILKQTVNQETSRTGPAHLSFLLSCFVSHRHGTKMTLESTGTPGKY